MISEERNTKIGAVVTVNGEAAEDELVSITYADDINGDGALLKLGSTAAATVKLVLDRPKADYTDAVLTVSVGGVPLGVFCVTDTQERDGRLTVEAMDAMAGPAMQAAYEPGTARTALEVIQEIAAGAGLTASSVLAEMFGTADGTLTVSETDGAVVIEGTANATEDADGCVTLPAVWYAVPGAPGHITLQERIADVAVMPRSGLTRRQMLGRMAALLGCNAHIDRDGALTLRWYTETGLRLTANDTYMSGLTKQTEDYTVGRIECEVTRTEIETETDADGMTTTEERTRTELLTAGTGRTGISIADEYMTQDILDGIYERLGGLRYRPMTVSLYGDARIETGDLITVTDGEGVTYAMPVMQVRHVWDGGVRTTLTSVGRASDGTGSLTGGALSQAVSALGQELARFKELEADNLRAVNGKFEYLRARKITADMLATGALSSGGTVEDEDGTEHENFIELEQAQLRLYQDGALVGSIAPGCLQFDYLEEVPWFNGAPGPSVFYNIDRDEASTANELITRSVELDLTHGSDAVSAYIFRLGGELAFRVRRRGDGVIMLDAYGTALNLRYGAALRIWNTGGLSYAELTYEKLQKLLALVE